MTWKATAPLFMLFAIGAATSGLAQSVENGLTLTIAGEERTAPLWAGQSDWVGDERGASINIFARGDGDNDERLVVTLGFSAYGWVPSGPEMTLNQYENGQLVRQLYAYEEEELGGLTVKLDSHAFDGTRLSLTGSFEATLGTSENYGNDIDLSDGVPVSGTFAVTLDPLD